MKNVLAIAALGVLAGCGSGNFAQNLNPLNWFSGNSARTVDGAPSLAPRRGYGSVVETRSLAAAIDHARIEPTAGGIIVKVEVAIPSSGFGGIDLVKRRDAPPGLVILEPRLKGAGGPPSLTVTAARFLSNEELARVREIQIISASNTAQIRP